MSMALITNAGHILMARHLAGLESEGITHCAIGNGDATFTDPTNPPAPSVDQVSLKNETARKRFTRRSFLVPSESGPYEFTGIRYAEAGAGLETSTVGIFFEFDYAEANGQTIKEYGFFADGVTYRPEVGGDLALGGVYNAITNPGGEVATPGRLFQIKNVPDYQKTGDSKFSLVCVCKI